MDALWQVVFTLGVLAGLTFIVGYACKAKGRWYRYPVGWHLMTMAASITATLGGLLWESVVGNISERIWLCMISAIVAAMWHQTCLLITTNGPPD